MKFLSVINARVSFGKAAFQPLKETPALRAASIRSPLSNGDFIDSYFASKLTFDVHGSLGLNRRGMRKGSCV